jgi:hypothetical protein
MREKSHKKQKNQRMGNTKIPKPKRPGRRNSGASQKRDRRYRQF